jgi:hypothetical protein
MKIENFKFGSIEIDGVVYRDDLVIDRGEARLRGKAASRQFRDRYGHTPLSVEEEIPWQCEHLIVGTGVDGKLPVMPEVVREAARRKVELVLLPTPAAIERLASAPSATNAILHLTC